MKTIFNKVLAGLTATALVATLLVGISVTKTVKAADEVTLLPWTFYSAGQILRSVDPDGWPIRYFNSVTTSEGEVKTGWDANFPNKQYVDGGEETWTATKVANGFEADIANTGWDGQYEGSTLVGDNPYMLRGEMLDVPLLEGHMYTVSFDIKWTDRANNEGAYNAPEKNVTFAVTNDYSEGVADKKMTIPSGTTESVTLDFTKYTDGNIDLSFSMGCFLYSNGQGLTTEKVAATGVLEVSNFKIVDNGQDPNWTPAPEPASTPAASTAPASTTVAPTTKAPTPTVAPTTAAPAKTKLAQVKKVKAVNKAAGKVKISWKKVTNAKQYKVKVGKKTYKTKKTKLVVKKLAIGTYKVKVRATKTTGYKAGAWSKTIKVKVTK